MKKILLILIIHISAFAQVPNTNTFTLSDVVTEVGAGNSLSTVFASSIDGGFDAVYKGSKNQLSNFRNYSHATIGTLEFSTTSTSNFNLTDIVKTGFTSFDYVVTGGLTTSGTGTSIDFSGNTGDANVVVSFSPSSEFDDLFMNNIDLSVLDVTNNVDLSFLYCNSNNLTVLDITNNVKLTILSCHSNNLTATANDNIAIALDNHGNSNGSLRIDNNFTAASAAARANLASKGWSIILY